jgi:hypothetical protein
MYHYTVFINGKQLDVQADRQERDNNGTIRFWRGDTEVASFPSNTAFFANELVKEIKKAD